MLRQAACASVSYYSAIIWVFLALCSSCNLSPSRRLQDSTESSQSTDWKEAYFAAEDIIAYAYMNSDLDTATLSLQRIYSYNRKLIQNKDLNNYYNRYIYIPNSFCQSCIDSICDLLKTNREFEKTAFILQQSYRDNYNAIIDQIGIPHSNLLYIADSLRIPVEDEDVIFMFTLSPTCKINNIYVPNKNLKYVTELYLNISRQKSQGRFHIRALTNK